MLSLDKKIVFITGASSGIGKACAEQYAAQGASLILTARRLERLETLADELNAKHNVECLALQMDVTDNAQVKKTISTLPTQWKNIDILVNNAGMAVGTDKIQDGDPENWDKTFNTNVNGLLYVTHAVLAGMLERDSGHIVNIGSIAGREAYPGGNIYCASKHAVRAINQSLRIDLLGTAIRVTEIAPGAVATEFSEMRWNDKARSDAFYAEFVPLTAEDIADTVIYATTRPLHVDVAEIVIYPTCQASANHLHRAKGTTKSVSP